MSALTKAFVVLTTVLSVLLVALVVPFVARTQNFQDQITSLEQQRLVAQQTARQRQLDLQNVADQLAAQQQQFQTQAQDLATQITHLQTQLQDERAKSATERAQLADLRASLTRLAAAAEQDAALLKTLREELKSARGELVDVRGRNIQLADRGVELQSQLEAYGREVRRLSERMVALQEEATTLRGVVESHPELREQVASGNARPVQAPEVRGEVTGVQKAGDTTLVSVDLGSSDGLEEGNRLMVARGQQYLGTLQIETVRERESAGRMVLQEGQVQEGDTIYGGQF